MNGLSYAREEWKEVKMGDQFTNDLKLEISNFGRIRTLYGEDKCNYPKGSMINGYKIIRLKMFYPRTPEAESKLNEYRTAISALEKEINTLKATLKTSEETQVQKAVATQHLLALQDDYSNLKLHYQKYLNKETRKRTFNFGGLIHRLVAENFLIQPSAEHTFVAHINFDKLDNKVSNLQWMTKEENVAHQQKSPFVIARKRKRKENPYSDTRASKLTLTQVMFIKKLLNEGKPIASLSRQFKVTETQIIRIKKKENWAFVEAAK